MRTDIITDKRQVYCPNSSMIGYSRSKARVGDYIFWHEKVSNLPDDRPIERLGRMLGRITWTSDQGKCQYIVVMVLHDCTHVGERWVKPADVTRVYSEKYFKQKASECMRMFLGHETRKRAKRDLTDARMAISEGWSSWKRFDDWKESRKI